MTEQHAFGGGWTTDKLERLRNYLKAYVKVLKNQTWTTVYVDAFAGTGFIPTRRHTVSETQLLDAGEVDGELREFITGSARIALAIEPPFDRYLFIESSSKKVKELQSLRDEFPMLSERIEIVKGDANVDLKQWVNATDWKKTRAVVFLDPYGMQVEWPLLEALASGKIDLWLLVPIGMGVNRLLTQGDLPPREWQDRLTRFFGTDEWLNEFYATNTTANLFDEIQTGLQKVANYDALAAYFVERALPH